MDCQYSENKSETQHKLYITHVLTLHNHKMDTVHSFENVNFVGIPSETL